MNLEKWDLFHGISVLAGLVVFHLTGSIVPVILIISLSVLWLWVSQWHSISQYKPAGGYANLLTLFRMILVISITAFSNFLSLRTLGILYIIPVSLDTLDGFLARRLNQKSSFGALFDMETDALFVALAGLVLVEKLAADAWILPVVYMRYIYVLVIYSAGLHGRQEKRTRFGPVVAVIMFISLLAGYLLPTDPARILLILACSLVTISFGYSFVTLFATRRNP
jgi:phosphatidylglycerophosphate synthase